MPQITVSLNAGQTTSVQIPNIHRVNSISTSPTGAESYVSTSISSNTLNISLSSSAPPSSSHRESYYDTEYGDVSLHTANQIG